MAYASPGHVTKLQYAQFIAASLSYLILQQQDSVGLVICDDAVRRYMKPAGQASQLKEILHLLHVTPAREKSDLGLVFNDLAERFKKRGVVVILSDLFDDPRRIVTGLKHFRHRRHEVIVFHILDPAELDFPFRDTTLFKGMEGMADILTDPHALRAGLPGRARGRSLTELEKGLPNGRHRLRSPSHRSSLDVALSSYLASRSARGFASVGHLCASSRSSPP